MSFQFWMFTVVAGVVSTAMAQGTVPAIKPVQGQVLESREIAPDKAGIAGRVTVVKTDLTYPYIRVEQKVRRDPITGQETVVATTEMAADHIIVKLRSGKVRADLAVVTNRLGANTLRSVGRSGTYLVSLSGKGIDAVPGALGEFRKEGTLIEYAEPDYLVYPMAVPDDEYYGEQWGVQAIHAAQAWNIGTGSRDVVVGVIDSGIDFSHPELAPNIWINQEELKIDSGNYPAGLTDSNSNGRIDPPELIAFMGDYDNNGVVDLRDVLTDVSANPFINDVNEDGNVSGEDGLPLTDDLLGWNFYAFSTEHPAGTNQVLDELGHGTHVAGIIGAVGNNGIGVAGVCWQTRVIAVQIFRGSPYDGQRAFASVAADAINYMTELGVTVTNNSYGGSEYSQIVYDAISDANDAGILFVAAAGNGDNWNVGYDTDVSAVYPQGYDLPNIISVAATDENDEFAWILGWFGNKQVFSNWGSKTVDLAAPGRVVLSTIPGGGYAPYNGTSMAAPHVTGACALYKSLAPTATHMQIKAAVVGTVDPLLPLYRKRLSSGGRLNLFKLLDSITNPDDDGDGVLDTADNCPYTYNPDQTNVCGPCFDPDGDGLRSWEYPCPPEGCTCSADNCSETNNPSQSDSDYDLAGDACDNCPTYNPNQEDADSDGRGDICDNCPNDANPDQQNTDYDQWGDACDGCPSQYQPDWFDAARTVSGNRDLDGDSIADYCDPCTDTDDDGYGDWGGGYGTIDDWPNTACDPDNCPSVHNPDQIDTDHDGLGDACDTCPGCGSWADADHDGDVDHLDFGILQACVTGDGSNIQPYDDPYWGYQEGVFAWGQCERLNFNGGWYIEYAEIVLFDRCASGPGVPADPSCGDCNSNGIIDALEDFDTDTFPDGDADGDGVDVRGRSPCVNGDTGTCDDNCPCDGNSDQADNNGRSDGDGVGDACEPPPPAPPPDPCETPENYFTITAWRSVRTHGAAGSLGIALDPDAALNEAVIEPRQGNTQRIEVDLTQPAYPWTDVSFIEVIGSDASQPVPSGYAFLNDDQTLRISFNAADPNNRLNDQVCYTIDLSNAIVDAGITTMVMCDADCAIRMLAADADENAAVEQADANAIAAANGQTAGSSNVRLDVNVDGVINGTDESIATGLIGNTVTCGGGTMSVGGEGVEITGRPMKKLSGAQDRSTADPSSRVGVVSRQSFSGASAPDLLTLLREAVASGQPLEQVLGEPRTLANVSASLVLHDTGATSVTLPAGGGTVAVDLVVTTDAPIWGFEGKPAVDAAGVVSINSADWTELDNVLFSHDVDGHTQSSHYDLTVMDWLWVRLTSDASDVTAWGMDVDSLLGADPPTVWTLTQDLTVINGPIATPTTEPAIQSPEPVQWFTTTATIGGVTREPLPAGQTILATLSLTISAQPGTYHLSLTAPQFTDTTHVTFPATAGQPLEIVIQGQ